MPSTTELAYEVFQDEQSRVPVKAWIKGVQLEDEAKQQLLNLTKMPFVHKHVAVMPDAHAGCGSTIGSVIPTTGAIIPAAVGVDLGCGMMAVKTTLRGEHLPDNLRPLRDAIETAVPCGRTHDGKPGDQGAWNKDGDDRPGAKRAIDLWNSELAFPYASIIAKQPKLDNGHMNHVTHLGTLGTGNHFIEVCLDEDGCVWVMLHSGSRGVGNRIGSYFIGRAREDMERYFINLPDKDLAYLPEGTELFADYVEAVGWAQDFAMHNRRLMMESTIEAMRTLLPEFQADLSVVNCHHNYVQKEAHFGKNVWVTRKGAVRARQGDMGLIPGSMGVGSYVVRGKGNADSFCSCSHGAGRTMSRTKAKATISLEQHIKDTEGVECRKDKDVLDETPAAYKPLADVIAAQADLIDVVHRLKPVVCVKG